MIMSYKYIEQEPVRTDKKFGQDDCDEYTHPAFGQITMSMVQRGKDTRLFGSDLGHHQTVKIRIHTAKVNRNINRDWIYGGKQILEFEMSSAQFAQFITSNGQGCGTPVTLRYAPDFDAPLVQIPYIKPIETRHEQLRKEIKDSAQKEMQKVMDGIQRLQYLADSGKIGKKDLNAALFSLKCSTENLPVNLAYSVESAEEALEKATSDAKIEVESYIHQTAMRLGLDSINDLAKLEKK